MKPSHLLRTEYSLTRWLTLIDCKALQYKIVKRWMWYTPLSDTHCLVSGFTTLHCLVSGFFSNLFVLNLSQNSFHFRTRMSAEKVYRDTWPSGTTNRQKGSSKEEGWPQKAFSFSWLLITIKLSYHRPLKSNVIARTSSLLSSLPCSCFFSRVVRKNLNIVIELILRL